MKTLIWMAIPLTQGLFALVDGEDYKHLNQWKWHTQKSQYTSYAVRHTPVCKGKRGVIRMHREILNVPVGKETDHINHNGLDNRRQNLRICTRNQNQHNRQSHCEGTSQYKSVAWNKISKKWTSTIGINGRLINLGHFDSEISAAKAYDKKAKAVFGEFANTNF